MIAVLLLAVLLALGAVGCFASYLYARRHPCSNPRCSGTAWWRVFLVLRPEIGVRPDMLARMPTPYRVCGRCFEDLDPDTCYPDRAWRRKVTAALVAKTRTRVDWTRTKLDREHALAAWARRLGDRS